MKLLEKSLSVSPPSPFHSFSLTLPPPPSFPFSLPPSLPSSLVKYTYLLMTVMVVIVPRVKSDLKEVKQVKPGNDNDTLPNETPILLFLPFSLVAVAVFLTSVVMKPKCLRER